MTQNSKRELARIKIEIIQKAGSGALDRNPVLAFQNDHSCQTCHAIMNVRFLDYLIAGHFSFGKSKTIETVYAAPTLIGLTRAYEQSTPIIITIPCQTRAPYQPRVFTTYFAASPRFHVLCVTCP
jgi:hypothetical protein